MVRRCWRSLPGEVGRSGGGAGGGGEAVVRVQGRGGRVGAKPRHGSHPRGIWGRNSPDLANRMAGAWEGRELEGSLEILT